MTELENKKGWKLLLDEFHDSEQVRDDHADDFIIWVEGKYEVPKKIKKLKNNIIESLGWTRCYCSHGDYSLGNFYFSAWLNKIMFTKMSLGTTYENFLENKVVSKHFYDVPKGVLSKSFMQKKMNELNIKKIKL